MFGSCTVPVFLTVLLLCCTSLLLARGPEGWERQTAAAVGSSGIFPRRGECSRRGWSYKSFCLGTSFPMRAVHTCLAWGKF